LAGADHWMVEAQVGVKKKNPKTKMDLTYSEDPFKPGEKNDSGTNPTIKVVAGDGQK